MIANARKNTMLDSPSIPFATPLSSVFRISGAACCTSSLALAALSTPTSSNQPWILLSPLLVFPEMLSDSAEMPPYTRLKIRTPTATSASRTRMAPTMRGTRWRSILPTAGPATAPTTAAKITGMTIVDVWASSQMRPTTIRTKPTRSHDEKPRFLSQVGAVNCGVALRGHRSRGYPPNRMTRPRRRGLSVSP